MFSLPGRHGGSWTRGIGRRTRVPTSVP